MRTRTVTFSICVYTDKKNRCLLPESIGNHRLFYNAIERVVHSEKILVGGISELTENMQHKCSQ
jgi:hypothetical protein